MAEPEIWSASFEAVRLKQEADIAKLTTPAQRFQWLEDAFAALAPFVKPKPEPEADSPHTAS